MRLTKLFFAMLLASTFLLPSGFAADHKEAPLIQEDPTADIADVYAFVNPNDPSKLVLAMTVNPFSVPSEAIAFHFSPNVRYAFHIDTDGDGRTNRNVVITFGDRTPTGQTFKVQMGMFINFEGEVTQPTEEPDPNPPIIVNGPAGFRAFAGPRDDPFFFDVVGFFRFLGGTGGFSGSDGFSGYNVSAIVVEVPLDLLPGNHNNMQVWAKTARRQFTLRRTAGGLHREIGPWVAVERMGNPAVSTALIPFDKKDLYNAGRPRDDANDFAADIVASLQALGTNEENIAILASVAVPDTLKLNANQPTAYPNGRALEDDVIDTLLFFIFNQQNVPDGVDANDTPFLASFPFLAPPHQPD